MLDRCRPATLRAACRTTAAERVQSAVPDGSLAILSPWPRSADTGGTALIRIGYHLSTGKIVGNEPLLRRRLDADARDRRGAKEGLIDLAYGRVKLLAPAILRDRLERSASMGARRRGSAVGGTRRCRSSGSTVRGVTRHDRPNLRDVDARGHTAVTRNTLSPAGSAFAPSAATEPALPAG